MNSKLLISLLVVLMLLLTSTGAVAQSSGPAAPQAPLGTGFTYQGQLKNVGGPVNRVCDMQFSLWNAAGSGSPLTGGAQVGITQTLAVTVTSGLFTTVLNGGNEFGNNAFTGEARWLQIAVRCPGGGGAYTTLSPRQALTAAPYALSLMPNATINGLNNMGNLSFGNTIRQMLNLWGTEYGIGVQFYNTYFRTDQQAGFAWHSGGAHSYDHYDPGPGGVTLMTLDANGLVVGHISSSVNSASPNAAVNATNTGSGIGVSGEGGLVGVRGHSASLYGVQGISDGCWLGPGLSQAETPSAPNYCVGDAAGVRGENLYNGLGIGGAGVEGYSIKGAGVTASSSTGNAVEAVSYGGNGLHVTAYHTQTAAVVATHAYGSQGATALRLNGGIQVESAGLNTATAAFVHQTVYGTNDCESQAFGGITRTYLNNPFTNNRPNAIILITPSEGSESNTVALPAEAPRLRYMDTSGGSTCPVGRWIILYPGNVDVPNGARFNILVVNP